MAQSVIKCPISLNLINNHVSTYEKGKFLATPCVLSMEDKIRTICQRAL